MKNPKPKLKRRTKWGLGECERCKEKLVRPEIEQVYFHKFASITEAIEDDRSSREVYR
jgi:ABC-type uncharacterized transport system substrate-binding protein